VVRVADPNQLHVWELPQVPPARARLADLGECEPLPGRKILVYWDEAWRPAEVIEGLQCHAEFGEKAGQYPAFIATFPWRGATRKQRVLLHDRPLFWMLPGDMPHAMTAKYPILG